ncbi:anaerobic ribonucleoside-triphosphate reductase activating protein [Parabacteroides sp. 52]|uniref:anaerobic ribonucleoside-triphosphate reductase activating protein n=1 Tax=unclassified Parabacteroides TaxID=2649774 RepID=UPI0013CF5B61|nr:MULTISPECIES: anaerobic ribonucleoside-triphosphate reductase activating protein [unclassified Parabacteroides]MDH6534724.1 anaerobic ribonucleoside-triphosphate reductase activating protein [Parabacteroides sp. PM5-20]NDV55732.1 anaerobic ribonucleoside-triphosphate reductase activating protein [Parabacteroides sp. 52]
MLQYVSYDIVFQEIPQEVTLAINLSNCPNRCKGCHSAYLMQNTGEVLTEETLDILLLTYGSAITCVCFMGGDADPAEVERLSVYLHARTQGRLKTGWYSGKKELPPDCSVAHFDYIKIGPYIEQLGGLDSPTTNQRFYRIDAGQLIDMTHWFQRNRKISV